MLSLNNFAFIFIFEVKCTTQSRDIFGADLVRIVQHPCYFHSGTLLQYENRKNKLKDTEAGLELTGLECCLLPSLRHYKIRACHAEEHIHCSAAASLVYFVLPLPFIPPFSCPRPACTSPCLTMTVSCPHSCLKMCCRNVDAPQG